MTDDPLDPVGTVDEVPMALILAARQLLIAVIDHFAEIDEPYPSSMRGPIDELMDLLHPDLQARLDALPEDDEEPPAPRLHLLP